MGKIIVDGKIYAEKTDENTVTFKDPLYSDAINVFWRSDIREGSDNSKRIEEIGSLSGSYNKVMILKEGEVAALNLLPNRIICTNSDGRVTTVTVKELQRGW